MIERSFADRLQNIEVVLIRVPEDWKMIYRIDQRWVKNNRDPENTVYYSLHIRDDPSADDASFLQV